jgi:hypothetical protein
LHQKKRVACTHYVVKTDKIDSFRKEGIAPAKEGGRVSLICTFTILMGSKKKILKIQVPTCNNIANVGRKLLE